jgi:xanthine dehydrogenase YagR molybdenum-binding subunit
VATAIADEASSLHGADSAAAEVRDGRMALRGAPDAGETYGALLARARMTYAEALESWRQPPHEAPQIADLRC